MAAGDGFFFKADNIDPVGADNTKGMLPLVQAHGHRVDTVESLAPDQQHLNPLQEQFITHHGLQCGFCTPGILMTLVPFLRERPSPDEAEIREALSGNLCRCTGYQNIVDAVKLAGGVPLPAGR